MKYAIGQSVVHLIYGVGVIRAIETKKLGSTTQTYYVVEIMDNGPPKKVFVPSDVNRLRDVMSLADAERIKALIEGPVGKTDVDTQTWNRRYRDYMEKVHSGSLDAIVEVFQALRALAADKDLSFGERKLLDQCGTLLYTEMKHAGLNSRKLRLVK